MIEGTQEADGRETKPRRLCAHSPYDGATHAGRGVRSICPGAKDITVRRTQKKVLMKHGPRTE